MQVNNDFWGGVDKITTDTGGRKYTSYDLMTALNNGDLPFNEIWDTSISPWAINQDADIVSICYPLARLGATTNQVFHETGRILAPEINGGVPFYFAIPHYAGSANGRNFNYNCRNGYSMQEIQDTTQNKYRAKVYAVREFDYSRLAYFLQVIVADYATAETSYDSNKFARGSAWTIASYINNYSTFADRPILGIKLTPYYATYDAYPNSREAVDWNINSLGNPVPLDQAMEGAVGSPVGIGYNEDYLDYFFCFLNSGGVIGSYGFYSYTLAASNGTYARDYGTAAEFNFGLSLNSRTIWQPAESSSTKINQSVLWDGSMYYWRTEIRQSDFTDQAALLDYIYKQVAYLGVWYCIDATDITSTAPGSSSNWFLGEIGADGITTGVYARGSDTSDLDNSSWSNPWDSSGWNGRSEDPNKYSDETGWNTGFLGTNDFSRIYLLTDLQVSELHEKFYQSIPPQPGASFNVQDYFTETFLTTEPIDVIMSLRYYNIELKDVFNVQQEDYKPLYLGSYDTGLTAAEVYAAIKRFNYGECIYYPYFGDFRDYEPYSYAELIVPYCGTVKISPADFMGHKLSIQMAVDFATGACTAFILKDSLVIDTLSGQMGIDIPVSSVAAADYQRDLFNNAQALKQAKTTSSQGLVNGALSIIGGIGSGDPLKAASAISNTIFGNEKADIAVETAEYNLEHTRINFKQVGAATPGINALAEQKARLVVYRPIMADYDPEKFAKINGYATITSSSLANYTGYTKCSSIKADAINCTAVEKNQIIKALQSGVYL